MPLTPEEQKIFDELMADPEVQSLLEKPKGAEPSQMNPRFYEYDSPLAKALAPAEATLAPIVGGAASPMSLGAAYAVPGYRGAKETLEARSPKLTGLGEFLGAAALPAGTGSAASAAGVGAAQAGLTSMGSGEGDPLASAVMGGLAGLAGAGLAKGFDAMQSGAGKLAESEAARSLGLTKGNIRRLGSKPSEMLERRLELGRSALDEGLVSPFKGTDELALLAEQKVKEAGEPIGAMMKQLEGVGESPGLKGTDLEKQLMEQLDAYLTDPLKAGERGGAEAVLEAIRQRHGLTDLSFSDLQKLKSDVGAAAYPVSPTGTPVIAGQQGYQGTQKAYTGIKELQEQTLEAAAQRNPSIVDFDNYLKNKKRYGDLQEIERYLTDAAAAEQARNVVPLRAAMGGAADLAGGGLPAAAATTAGLTVAQKSAHPAAALMLDKMEKIMGSKYGQMARETLKRGPKAFVSMDFMLQQTDPEYRKLLGITEAQ